MNNPKKHPVETTKIINGADAIFDDWKEFTAKAKKLDVYFDKNAIALAIQKPVYRDTYVKLREKDVRTRVITEITKDNLHQSKILSTLAGQLRHLEGSPGGMAVSNIEFRAAANFQSGVPVSQAISSNSTEFVKQQQHIFDMLWKMSVPAEQRIKEIEEGIVQHKTEILSDSDEIISAVKAKYSDAKELMLCLNSGGLQVIYNNYLSPILQTLENERNGLGSGVRIMTLINIENIELIKKLIDLGVKIRHVTHLPPMNFSCSEQHVFLTIEEMKDGTHATRLLSSNESAYLIHFASIFERFWKTGIDGNIRITDIERGGTAEDTEIIYNSSEAKNLYIQLMKSAQKEIKIIYPTINAFLRQRKFHVPQMLMDAAKENGVNIRVISGQNELIEKYFSSSVESVQVRFLEKPSEIKTTFLIVDNKYTLDLEIKDDSADTFEKAIGFSTYSTSKASVHSHAAIFDYLWIQSKLYAELKESNRLLEVVNQKLETHYNMQRDFIDIAAHELRTPIQPILGLSEVLKDKVSGQFETQLINIIVKNALRLQVLAENILDVTRIEGGTLNLKKEKMDLDRFLQDIVDDFKHQILSNVNTIELKIDEKIQSNLIISADKFRLTQVLTNLLNNAIKFTKCGIISLTVDKSENNAIITVADTGIGIPEDILLRVFDKFISKSEDGTGIGLFITKGIVEKHGGKIFAENNIDGKGSKFTVILPIS